MRQAKTDTNPIDAGVEGCLVRTGVSAVDAIDLFRDATLNRMDEIERALVARHVARGQVLYAPGETGEVLFFLKEGSVRLYRLSAEGRKLVLARVGAGAFFGEMSCIGQGMYDAFAEAAEDSTVFAMSCEDVTRLLLSDPQLSLRLLEALGRRVVEAEQQLEEFAFKGLVPRVAALLLKLADENGAIAGRSHQDLADELGVYRETVSSALGELKSAGAIEVGRKRIVVRDAAALGRAAYAHS